MWLVSTMVDRTILESSTYLLYLFKKRRNTVSSVENSYRFPLDFLETTLAPQDLTCFVPKLCLGCSACFKEAGPPDSGGVLLPCVYYINTVPQVKTESSDYSIHLLEPFPLQGLWPCNLLQKLI